MGHGNLCGAKLPASETITKSWPGYVRNRDETLPCFRRRNGGTVKSGDGGGEKDVEEVLRVGLRSNPVVRYVVTRAAATQ